MAVVSVHSVIFDLSSVFNPLRGLLLAMPVVMAAPVSMAAVPVVIAPVERAAIVTELEYTGSVNSPSVAQLSVAIAGLAQAVMADAGQKVVRGETLLQLDDEVAGLRLRGAEAALTQGRHNLRDARRRLKEIQALRADQSVAESTVLSQQSEVAAQLALVQKLTADAARERALLARHQVRAPFAGVVSQRLVEPGEWINPGKAIFELVATEGLRIDLAIPEEHLGRIDRVTTASISPVSDPDRVLSASVAVAVPVADPVSRTFLLRLSLPDNHGLAPGMSVRARLKVPVNRDGLVVPRDAVLRYPDGRVVVWVVKGEGAQRHVAEKLVRLGATFDNRVEVVGDIAENDAVVIEGNEALTDGQLVTVTQRRR